MTKLLIKNEKKYYYSSYLSRHPSPYDANKPDPGGEAGRRVEPPSDITAFTLIYGRRVWMRSCAAGCLLLALLHNCGSNKLLQGSVTVDVMNYPVDSFYPSIYCLYFITAVLRLIALASWLQNQWQLWLFCSGVQYKITVILIQSL